MRRGKRLYIIIIPCLSFLFSFLSYSISRASLYPGQIITIEGIAKNTSGKNFSLISKFGTTTVNVLNLKNYDKKILNLSDRPILKITGLVERKSNRYYIIPTSPNDIKIIAPSTKEKTTSRKRRASLKSSKNSMLNISTKNMPKENRLRPDSKWPKTKKILILASGIEAILALAILLKYNKAH